MKIFRSFEEARVIRNPVVTTGSFDGVHLGHKTILNRLKMLAEKNDGESVLITFHPHPRKVLYPETAGKDLKLINTQEEKLELLEKAGLDNVIIIEFTRDFSAITSEQFVKEFLCNILRVKVVVVGFNHHFGFNKQGDSNQLREMGIQYNFITEEIPEQEVQHETVSSTLIRKAIGQGYIQRANAYLDHFYIITGVPQISDYEIFPDDIHFYNIPMTEDTKLLPSPGIYAVSTGNNTDTCKGMAVINRNETGEHSVFLHPFEREYISMGRKTTLYFHKKIHGEISPGNSNRMASILHSAIAEISDLIY
jgi:riboflavin kinase/FMN adenylyltransferase